MGARAETAAKTRAAIVFAARQLHAERGLVATSWDDIADRAGVSKATVYRHFPSLAELVPACAQTVFDLIQPLTPEQAAGAFASMDRAAACSGVSGWMRSKTVWAHAGTSSASDGKCR